MYKYIEQLSFTSTAANTWEQVGQFETVFAQNVQYDISVEYGNSAPYGIGWTYYNETTPMAYIEHPSSNGAYEVLLPITLTQQNIRPFILVKSSRVGFKTKVNLCQLKIS